MESVDVAAFARRAVESRPCDEDGVPLRCYARIRAGARNSHARVRASGMKVEDDPGKLAEEIRTRLLGMQGDSDAPKAWVEVLVKGESTPYDTMYVALGGDQDEETPFDKVAATTDQGIAYVLVTQTRALVDIARDANRTAQEEKREAARLIERLASKDVEIEKIKQQGEQDDALMGFVSQYGPIAAIAGLKMAGVELPKGALAAMLTGGSAGGPDQGAQLPAKAGQPDSSGGAPGEEAGPPQLTAEELEQVIGEVGEMLDELGPQAQRRLLALMGAQEAQLDGEPVLVLQVPAPSQEPS